MRFLLILVAALVAMWVVITASARLAAREALGKPWPGTLGTIRDVPRRYPPHPTTTEARNLAELVSPAGVQLGMRGEEVAIDPIGEELDRQFVEYVYRQLQKPDDTIDAPPPEIEKALHDRQQVLADATRYINQSASSIDWREDAEPVERPYPPFIGIQSLNRLLAANALLKRDASSWDDIHAIVLLARPLWRRQDEYCNSVALSGARLANGVARKLPPPVPAWWPEVAEFDARHAMLAAYQGDSRIWWNWLERRRQRQPLLAIPFSALFDASEAAFLNRRRRAAEEYATSHECSFDAAAWDERWKLPSWMFIPGKYGSGVDFQRAAVFDFERSGTERVLAIKEHRPLPSTSRCSDGTWSYANGTLQFSRTIPIASPGRPAVPGTLHY